MGIEKTLGGDRIGSGNRMKQDLHNFYRSNHNLSTERNTSMANGVLYPIFMQVGLDGDTFDINTNAAIRTIPTQGMLFGRFKLQVDIYKVPVRLYQAILHNNTTEIGMNMNQVLLPKIKLKTKVKWVQDPDTGLWEWKEQINKSALLNYLGIAGIGRHSNNQTNMIVERKFNAVPMLAYYDIFKNYYANKQEEDAYVIVSGESTSTNTIESTINACFICTLQDCVDWGWQDEGAEILDGQYIRILGTNLLTPDRKANVEIRTSNGDIANNNSYLIIDNTSTSDTLVLENISGTTLSVALSTKETTETSTTGKGSIRLQSFPLKNIDEMRKRLLTYWDLGEEIVIDANEELLPYNSNTDIYDELATAENYGELKATAPMQGLVVKTYQSDMFNNWLDTEWVNMVTELSSVSTTSGSFTIDALNFAKKVYNHYNRIAISGGTYQDWQEATYGEKVYGMTEKPVYCGGMSAEVIFDEVVNAAATEENPLGQLGGRGNIENNSGRGGHVVIKVTEPSIIMAIASLTPRVKYGQGNSWIATELDSMDDFHKPMFDRIGFQDLLVENMAWWDTRIDLNGNIFRSSIGKQPAWIHYMTDVDRVYADFAQKEGRSFMVLQRLYDTDQTTRGVADITTYVEPQKYNYAFAYSAIDAQNFWGFFNFNIKARRKMSATQIPNL